MLFCSWTRILLGLSLCLGIVSALQRPLYHPHEVQQRRSSSFPALWKNTTLDHFNPLDSRTFLQRYYVNDMYWDVGKGPVILYINGEGPVSGPPHRSNDLVVILAQEFKALIVTLEHRYYGLSVPFPTLPTSNMAYLSSQQALFDLAEFMEWYQENHISNSLSVSEQKWMTVGGSYSGALSAWFRLKYPQLTRCSIASSGVVHAIVDFPEFDEQVAKSVGPACAQVLRDTTAQIEQNIASNETATKMLFDAAMLVDNGDFFYLMADIMATSVQYGYQADLCDPLEAASAQGLSLINTFANYTKSTWYPLMGPPGVYATSEQKNTTVSEMKNYRQWWFQKCTEFGWFQVAPAHGSIRSHQVNLEYHRRHCKEVFGQDLWPNGTITNTYYGGNHTAATEIFFSNGSQDPWQRASVFRSLSRSEPENTITCHNCGHCVDLGGCPGGCDPSEPLQRGRSMEVEFARSCLM